MTKTDVETILNNLGAKDLDELQNAIKARKKAGARKPTTAALALLKSAVEQYGFKDVRLAFTVVRREAIEAAKANKAAKPAKAKPAKKGK